MTGPIPEGVSRADFDAAITALEDAVGPSWVFTDHPALGSYNDHFALRDPVLHAPSAAVAPGGIPEIQKVLAVAREYRIPVWAVSTGRNLAYGGPAPRKPGSIVIDLKRMNRILEVNERHAYAVVEPGVSYFDLYAHLQRTGSKLWIDCAAPGWGGVVGNLMDRGVGYTPYGEHFSTSSGMQIVLADGSVVETGMGAQAGSAAAHTYNYGRGPWVDGMFTQANYGIATRLTIRLMPEPPGYRPYMVTFPRDEDIAPVTDIIRPLKLSMLIPNAAVTVDVSSDAAVSHSRAQLHREDAPMPESVRRHVAEELGIGKWNFYGALYGPEPLMDNNWAVIRDAFAQVPGAKFYFAEDRENDPVFQYRSKLMRGIPNMAEFSILNWVPNGGHVGFSPMAPVSGETALEQYMFVRERAFEYGFDYIGGFIIGWRDMHHIFDAVFSRDDPEQKRRAYELMELLIDEAASLGHGEYRTHLDFMDRIAATYNWNNDALGRVNQRLKAALDPTGILSPGKSGIWPSGAMGEAL